MSRRNFGTAELEIGEVVIKLSESKELYFEVIAIDEELIKIKALGLPIYTYVSEQEIIRAPNPDLKKNKGLDIDI